MSRPIKYFLRHPQQIISSILMKYGGWIPDALYLRIQYRILMGKSLNLRNPKTFTEKIQWLKLNHRTSEMTMMVDKYSVKDFVAKKIGSQYVIPTLGVWESIESVDWESLPNQFVLKTTHGGGGTGVVIVKDKKNVTHYETLERLRWSFNDEGYTRNREWPYKNVHRRIIAEELIGIPGTQDLLDYKFFCFDGEPLFFKVDFGRFSEHHANYYDLDWKQLPFGELKYPPKKDFNLLPPKKFNQMIEIARILSKGQKFIRVDLYNVAGKIYFGEMTFYPASGLEKWTTDNVDLKLGKEIKLI